MKTKLSLLILSLTLQAQVVTDGTLGSITTLDGTDITITQDLGTTSGNNLFHSFKTFNIDSGNKVTFTGTDTLENVISRVTGGTISNINGTLKSNITNANFYFFNPAGIVLGENASIDVPASLHISTADYLTLEDGSIFRATNPNESTLGIAKPEAFGYLDRAATSLVLDGAQLLLYKQDIEISSYDIEFKNSSLLQTINGGDISINAKNNINIIDSSSISCLTDSDNNSGTINIFAKEMYLFIESKIFTSTDSEFSGNANDITMNINDKLEIFSSKIYSESDSFGDSGSIELNSGSLSIDGNDFSAEIYSIAYIDSHGSTGDIKINVDGLIEFLNATSVYSESITSGDSGTIEINAKDFYNISGDSYVYISTSIFNDSDLDASAGSININIDNDMKLIGDSEITSSTYLNGDAGNININAKNLYIDVNGGFGGIYTISDTELSGDAGTIDIFVDNTLEIMSGAQISSDTFSAGNAGKVNIKSENILIEGNGYTTGIFSNAQESSSGNAGSININSSGLLKVYDGSQIASNTYSQGNAGYINIKAGSMEIDTQGSQNPTGILSATGTDSSGNAGLIDITIDNYLGIIDGLISSSTSFRSSGDAGSISVLVNGLLELSSGGQILTNTWSTGNAGKINVIADHIKMDGANSQWMTGIFSSAGKEATGLVGDVDISTNNLEMANLSTLSIANYGNLSTQLLDNFQEGTLSLKADNINLMSGATIQASSYDNAPASNIKITSKSINLNSLSSISTSANTNNGGSITINNSHSIALSNSLITTSTNGGNGGDIIINSGALMMNTGIIQANTDLGALGGNIEINTDSIITKKSISPRIGGEKELFISDSGKNIIQAAAPQGNPGSLNIISPKLDLTSSLAKLSTHYVNISELVKDPCSTTTTSTSSLIAD